jgi:photosystem II stability/assembly factor-like uncharacterized protein
MKKALFLCLLSIFLISCKSTVNPNHNRFSSIVVDTLLKDKISIRAIAIDGDIVYYAANKSRVGYINLKDNSKFERRVNKDSLDLEFRSIAVTNNAVNIVNVANPAFLFRLSKDLIQKQLVYEERNEKVFYDSMQFWNDNDGIALSDPTTNCLAILLTNDGGKTWHKSSCDGLPKMNEGEAAFAASNTNIIIKGTNTWIVSGGKKSRVFYSSDKGISWIAYETPIIQGEAMTGIFTADFYNDKIGFIAGGNYEKPNQNFQNKALTNDGGKTWKLVGENTGFGYASCIQFIPNSNGKGLVCVGITGLFYSNDTGATWTQLSQDSSLYTLRFINDTTAIAAGKDKIIRIKFQ